MEETELEIGDLVEIKSWETLLKEGTNSYGDIVFAESSTIFAGPMRNLCGELAVVTNFVGDRIILKFKNEKYLREQNIDIFWNYIPKFVTLIEKGYQQRIQKEAEERAMKNEEKQKIAKKEVSKDELVAEMKEKVDIKKIKKILSLSFMTAQKDLLGIDKLIDQWANAKYKLYDLLGRTLRLEKEIEYDAGEMDWTNKKEEIIQEFPGTYYMLRNISWVNFRDNEYRNFDTSFTDKYLPQVKDGMKLTRFLSLAFKNPELDTLISKKVDETRIKGILTISIDPIDYLLMSLNKSGWQSCHSIHEDSGRSFGCYVGGLFSYMVDHVTAIAYRHSPEEVEYNINRGKFKEYSKNWRECLYIDTNNGNFVASRQYPREDKIIAKSVREMLEEVCAKYYSIANSWKVISDTHEIRKYMANYDMEMGDVCQDVDESCALHYNDIWYGFNGKIVYNKEQDNLTDTAIFVGNEPICPICGENYIDDHSHPCCDHCYYEM